MWRKAKKEAKHVKDGLCSTYKDAIYWHSLRKVEDKSISELRDYAQISKDLLKMVPFSLFVTIPLAELLLPAYLKIFPNAMP